MAASLVAHAANDPPQSLQVVIVTCSECQNGEVCVRRAPQRENDLVRNGNCCCTNILLEEARLTICVGLRAPDSGGKSPGIDSTSRFAPLSVGGTMS